MSDRAGTTVHVHGRDGVPTCTYCRGACRVAPAPSGGPDAPSELAVVCGGCQAHYHPDCLAELGACATIGCPAPLASRVRRVIVIEAPRCCRAGPSGGRVMLCDACGARWHADCLPRLQIDACCPGHGFAPEVAAGRARERGPRVGSERTCTACSATFQVQAATRYSPHCPSCRAWRNVVGLCIAAVILTLYAAAVIGAR